MRRTLTIVGIELIAVAVLAISLNDTPAQEDIAVRGMITPATQTAIDNGLAFLAAQQKDDGSFGNNGGNIAYTSLAGLAFMAGGNQPGRGKYGAVVRKTVENILNLEDRGTRGYLHNPNSNMHGPMYGHGFAMLFLGDTTNIPLDRAIAAFFVLAMVALIGSFCFLLREIFIASKHMRIAHDARRALVR